MPNEMSWTAKDQKNGMTAEELESALDVLKTSRPGVRWKLRARVGFSSQIQKVTFVEEEG